MRAIRLELVIRHTHRCVCVCVPRLITVASRHVQEPSAMDTSGAAVGVAPPVPPPTFQVSQVRGPEAFLSSTAPAQVREWAPGLDMSRPPAHAMQ